MAAFKCNHCGAIFDLEQPEGAPLPVLPAHDADDAQRLRDQVLACANRLAVPVRLHPIAPPRHG